MTQRIWLDPESWLDYLDSLFAEGEDNALLEWAMKEVDWEERGDSRLLAWYGDFDYQYPGVSHAARPIPAPLLDLCARVQGLYPEAAPHGFDGIRLNRYDSGTAFVDFHADNEPSLAAEYPVAFITLGRPRVLLFRPTSRTVHPGYAFTLSNASMLVMGGMIQERWHHGVPVEPQRDGTRISITLRKGAHTLARDLAATEGREAGGKGAGL